MKWLHRVMNDYDYYDYYYDYDYYDYYYDDYYDYYYDYYYDDYDDYYVTTPLHPQQPGIQLQKRHPSIHSTASWPPPLSLHRARKSTR